MQFDADQTASWSARLEQDGEAPPTGLVDRCVALFGRSPEFVFGYHEERPGRGQRWTVVACDGALIGQVVLTSAGAGWESDAHAEAWVVPVTELVEIRLRPRKDDGRRWTRDEGGSSCPSAWTLRFRGGACIKIPLRAVASNDEVRVAELLVDELRARWARSATGEPGSLQLADQAERVDSR